MAKRTIKLEDVKVQSKDSTGVVLRHYRWNVDYSIPSSVARKIGKQLIQAANKWERTIANQVLQERRDHGFATTE